MELKVKISVKLRYILFTLAVIHTTLIREGDASDSGAAATLHGGSSCPSKILNSRITLSHLVFKLGQDCVNTLRDHPSLKNKTIANIEGRKDYYKSFCQHKSVVTNCLDIQLSNVEACHNDTVTKAFESYKSIVESGLITGCQNYGEEFAIINQGIADVQRNKTLNDQYMQCNQNSAPTIHLVESSDIDISSKIYLVYKEAMAFKKCNEEIAFVPEFKIHVLLFISAIVNNMKCAHPKEETMTTCKELDADTFHTSCVCQIVKRKTGRVNLYDYIEKEIFGCLRLITTTEISRMRTNVSALCTQQDYAFVVCQNRINNFASRCLKKENSELDIFRLVWEYGRKVRNLICENSTDDFAAVLREIYRLHDVAPGLPNVALECVRTVTAGRQKDSAQTKDRRLYSETLAVRECLLGKLEGEASRQSAGRLFDKMLNFIQCIHPETKDAVPCKSITNH